MIRPALTHIPLEDTDVPTVAAAKRPRHYRRTAPRPVQPSGLTRESEQAILYNACWVFGYVVLLCIAFWAMGGGAVATVDADVYGPDELAHARAGRL